MRRAFASVLLMLVFAVARAQHPASTEYARDLHDRPLTSLGDGGTKAVVLFFVATDCPISNRTFPEMKRVREEFTAQGVRFWFVYANDHELPDAVRAHQTSFDEGGDAILDTDGRLTHMTGAKVTPEAAILRPEAGPGVQAPRWTPVFVGRIDNLYERLGVERPQATEHFTERVLHELLEGKPIEKPDGKLIGCSIVRPSQSPAKPSPEKRPE